MFLKKKSLTLLCVALLLATSGFSQGKFKAGLGFNYLSNNLDHEYLESYFIKSLHLSYAVYQRTAFSLSVESATALKSSEADYVRTTSFITSLPVLAQYDFRKMALHAGAGPAYLYHRAVYNQQKYQASGSSLQLVAGTAWKGNPILADAIYPEFTLRLNYFKSFRSADYDAGMISFIIFLRGT